MSAQPGGIVLLSDRPTPPPPNAAAPWRRIEPCPQCGRPRLYSFGLGKPVCEVCDLHRLPAPREHGISRVPPTRQGDAKK